jgi:RNA polymerase sigma factor (sigma-70 family)
MSTDGDDDDGRTPDEGGQAPDAVLLGAYVSRGDETAFAALVRRHVNLVYRAALRQSDGDTHRAAEATQLVFTLLARKAAGLARHPSLTGWLYTTTHFTVSDQRRRERRRQAREMEAHMMNEATREERVEWDRLRPVLDEAMQQLGERDRDALLARFFEGRSFAEVGARFAATEDAARMRVERALEKLRTLLARRGVTSTGAALGVMLTSEAARAAPAGLAASVTGPALAGAAVTTPASGLMAFMTTTKFVAGAAGLVLLLSVGVAVREVRQSRAAAARWAVANNEMAALAARVRVAHEQAAVAERDLARREKAVAQDRQAGAAREAELAASVRDPGAAGQAFLAAHPEIVDVVHENARHGTTQRFQLLFERLRLTPAQLEQFYAVMIQADAGLRWNTSRQAPIVKFEIGEKLTREARMARLQQILGAEGFREFQEFSRLEPARRVVDQVTRGLYYSATPMTAVQAEQLAVIVAQASAPYRAGSAFSGATLDWDQVVGQARGLLSASQLTPLLGLQEEAAYRRVHGEAVAQAMQDARKAAGIPPNW